MWLAPPLPTLEVETNNQQQNVTAQALATRLAKFETAGAAVGPSLASAKKTHTLNYPQQPRVRARL
jgi:hypothetical protein